MNMIRHDHKGMKEIVSEDAAVVMDSVNDDVRDGRLAQIESAIAGLIEQSIHGRKGLSGAERVRWEKPMRRKTVVKTPSQEYRTVRRINMRKPTSVELHTGLVR